MEEIELKVKVLFFRFCRDFIWGLVVMNLLVNCWFCLCCIRGMVLLVFSCVWMKVKLFS